VYFKTKLVLTLNMSCISKNGLFSLFLQYIKYRKNQ